MAAPAACDAGVDDTRDRTNNGCGVGAALQSPIARSRCDCVKPVGEMSRPHAKAADTRPPLRRSHSNPFECRLPAYFNRVAISFAIAFIAAFVGASVASAFSKPKSWIVPS